MFIWILFRIIGYYRDTNFVFNNFTIFSDFYSVFHLVLCPETFGGFFNFLIWGLPST